MLALPVWGTKTGSDAILNFTIAFRIHRNLLPEKTAQINQLQAVKRWHFLFDEQNRKWCHFKLHHCVPHPEKPSFRENGTNQSFTGWKLRALPVLWVKEEVILKFAIVFSIPRNPYTKKTARINQYMAGKCWHFCIPVKGVGFPLYFPQTFHWLKFGSAS